MDNNSQSPLNFEQIPNNPIQSPMNVAEFAPQKKGIKKKKIIIAVVTTATVLVGGITAFASKNYIVNAYQKTFYSPEKYYQAVEKRSVNKSLKDVKDNYDYFLDLFKSQKLTTKLSVETSVDSSLFDEYKDKLSGVDLSKLKNISFDFIGSKDGDEYGYELVGNINNKEVASANMAINFEDEKFYAQIPTISQDYIDVLSSIKEVIGVSSNDITASDKQMIKDATSQDNIEKLLPDSDKLFDFISDYSDIVVESIDDVSMENGSIAANDVEQKCTILNVNLDGNTFYNILKQVLKNAKDDEFIPDYISNIYDYSELFDLDDDISDFDKDKYSNSVDELLKELKEHKADITNSKNSIEMTVYVDAKGDVIGRELTFNNIDDNTDEHTTIYYYKTVSGKDYGIEAGSYIKTDNKTQELIKLLGGGDYNIKDLNGEFTLSINDENHEASKENDTIEIYIQLKDCNIIALARDQFSGNITISTNLEDIKDYSLDINIDTKRNSTYTKFTVNGKDKEYGYLSFQMDIYKEATSYMPDNDDNIVTIASKEDLNSYISNFDFDKYINNVLDASGIVIDEDIKQNFMDSVNESVDSGFDNFADDSYDDDDYDFNFDDDNDYDYDYDYDYDSDDDSDDDYNFDFDNDLFDDSDTSL